MFSGTIAAPPFVPKGAAVIVPLSLGFICFFLFFRVQGTSLGWGPDCESRWAPFVPTETRWGRNERGGRPLRGRRGGPERRTRLDAEGARSTGRFVFKIGPPSFSGNVTKVGGSTDFSWQANPLRGVVFKHYHKE